jgi:hypothetical protein
MSNKSSAPPTTTTTVQKSDPWSGQQPYLKQAFSAAGDLYNQGGPQYYPGSTVAGFTPEQTQAYQSIENAATAGSPLLDAARNTTLGVLNGSYTSPVVTGSFTPTSPDIPLLSGVASGQYLGSNPTLDATYRAAADPVIRDFKTNVLPSIDRSVAGSNATGSGMHAILANNAADTLTRNLGSISANIYGTDYENERNRMLNATTALGSAYRGEEGLVDNANAQNVSQLMGAAGAAPATDATKYSDAASLLGVGQAYQGLNAANLQDAINRYNYNQQLPYNTLATFENMIQGNYGGTTNTEATSVQPYAQSNPWLGGLSGAASGAAIGTAFGPWGTGIGAGLGGLIGLLGS